MIKYEYESLQQALSALLDKERLRYKRIGGREKDGYEMGVLACKSVLAGYNADSEGEA